jgi:DNA polymerase
MADALHIDFETFSECDLTKEGAHKYAMHASTTAICAAWAINDEEPALWLPGEPCPDRVFDHIMDDGEIAAWNAQFERLIFKYVMGPKFGWPVPALRSYRCIMVQALAMALPGKLEKAAPAIGLEQRKDDVGRRVMLQICRPRTPTKKIPDTRWTKERYPEKFAIVYTYCLQDVRVEQGVDSRTVKLKRPIQERYWLDQEINDRGVPIDIDLVRKAQAIVDVQLDKLDRQMRLVTGGEEQDDGRVIGGEVASTNAVKQLVTWLKAGGLDCDSVAKDPLIRLLARDDLTNAQRVALQIRQEAAKTSTAKLEKFESFLADDGTIKGTLQFHGAMTGRDAARGVQVQNFPRPSKKTNILEAIGDIRTLDPDLFDCFYANPLSTISDCLRSMIATPEGHTLYARDLSQIEARLTAYLAGQDNIVEAFRLYDQKLGPDIYIVTAAGIYDVKPDEIDAEDPRRQVGKVSVLALGFGGGGSAFGSMAKIYQVDLVPLLPVVWEMADDLDREKAVEAYKQRGRKSGMRKEAWTAAELVKLAWRTENADTVSHWKALEDAAIDAMLKPGETFHARGISYRKTGSFLRCILPSGRSIFYCFPKLKEVLTPWGVSKLSISFMGQDGVTKQWKEFHLYGGFQHQNCVQSVAADVMWEAVIRCEAAGYPNRMRVHDEMIAMTLAGFGSEEEYHQLITTRPSWAPDLPIAADGWRNPRYGKWK